MSDSKSLVSLAQESAAIEVMLIESGGEITPEIEAALTITEVQLPAKVDKYAFLLERTAFASAYYKKRSEEFKSVSKSLDNFGSSLKDRLKFAMEAMQTRELLGIDAKFKIQNNPASLVVENEIAIPDEYKIEKREFVLDTAKIMADLKAGKEISGVSLSIGTHVRKYANKGGH